MTLSLTGSWSDRTAGVVDPIVVQVAVVIDIEHISIAVGIHVRRRERPNRGSSQIEEVQTTRHNEQCSNINLFPISNFKINF